MTNGERYKTAAERLAAYTAYCQVSCAHCLLRGTHSLAGCAFGWLDLEYKPSRNFENYQTELEAKEAWYRLMVDKKIPVPDSCTDEDFIKWLFDKPTD